MGTARRLGSRGELRHMPVEEGSEEQLPLVMTHQKSEFPTKAACCDMWIGCRPALLYQAALPLPAGLLAGYSGDAKRNEKLGGSWRTRSTGLGSAAKE